MSINSADVQKYRDTAKSVQIYILEYEAKKAYCETNILYVKGFSERIKIRGQTAYYDGHKDIMVVLYSFPFMI